MKFINKGNFGLEIQFEETDRDSEMRIVEQGVAFIKDIIQRIREAENNKKPIGED